MSDNQKNTDVVEGIARAQRDIPVIRCEGFRKYYATRTPKLELLDILL